MIWFLVSVGMAFLLLGGTLWGLTLWAWREDGEVRALV